MPDAATQEAATLGHNAPDPFRAIIGFSNLGAATYGEPLVIERGAGARVFDKVGADYIDATANFYSAAFGFHEPELVEAARVQMGRISNFSTLNDRTVEPVITLADRIARRLPMANARVGFATSGSEANEAVLKFLQLRNGAQGKANRRAVVSRWGSYHGSTMATTTLGGMALVHDSFAIDTGDRLFASQPDPDEFGRPGESAQAFGDRLVDELDTIIKARGAEKVSAFIAEPIGVAAGSAVPPPGYFPGVQDVLRKHKVAFVADEVITGFGRLGTLFGSQKLGLTPDAMTMAKAINSGYLPISAYAFSGELYDEIVDATRPYGALMHGGVYHGNPVAAAVALKCLDLYDSRGIEAHVARMGARLERELTARAGHPLVMNTRCIGLVGALKFDTGRLGMGAAPGIANEVVAAAVGRHRLIVRVSAGAIVLAPPLVVTDEEMDELFRRLDLALADVLDARTRAGTLPPKA